MKVLETGDDECNGEFHQVRKTLREVQIQHV